MEGTEDKGPHANPSGNNACKDSGVDEVDLPNGPEVVAESGVATANVVACPRGLNRHVVQSTVKVGIDGILVDSSELLELCPKHSNGTLAHHKIVVGVHFFNQI